MLTLISQRKQQNNLWHCDHLVLSKKKRNQRKWVHLLLKSNLKATSFWIIHFSGCRKFWDTFACALRLYHGSRGGELRPHNQVKVVMNPQGDEYYLYPSAVFSLTAWVFLPPNTKIFLSYSQLIQRLAIILSCGWLDPCADGGCSAFFIWLWNYLLFMYKRGKKWADVS